MKSQKSKNRRKQYANGHRSRETERMLLEVLLEPEKVTKQEHKEIEVGRFAGFTANRRTEKKSVDSWLQRMRILDEAMRCHEKAKRLEEHAKKLMLKVMIESQGEWFDGLED